MKGIVFFDMEGTLLRKAYHLDDGKVAPSAWTLLAEALGEECLAEENKTKDIWISGGYESYLEWMQSSTIIHKKYGLHRDLFYRIINSVELTKNTQLAIKRIKELNFKTVLISGGFKALADRVQVELEIDHSFSACEYFFDKESGLLRHMNLLPTDEAGKADFMHLMCREYKISPSNCAFVGDGMNDIHLAQQVGYSISFNGQKKLKDVASAHISQKTGEEDFMPVFDLINSWHSIQ
ncbi:TPA: HAD family hydrolase [Pseudomonas aeruginosa]|uniref:HAD family hydrolase n=1 Tax=Pseudomonas aeruginosa TaxID=287 RepID=UPI0003B96E95|nr:HAD family hydrolase [Pseudomonas aeruginosa]ERY75307.1 hypothetical protein Q029_02136 [Pseudomonas aeruginosa BWHPSA016]MBI7254138.1 HAD family hydrolase [Pseudomonas aeruginosa]MCS7788634.1 HAD family hydrolase [Pseudomonas aeruginosa]MCV0111371.1 HAD family hydrolase [Pseudomonas aeruginosa]MCV0117253.1 HAD family hydrolase [Pseudomonas aeruginosa]